MKNYSTRYWPALFLLCCIAGFAACKKTKDCPLSDKVNAGFSITEEASAVNSYPPLLDYTADTNSGYSVRFTAAIADASYEWHIGINAYTQRSFSLDFSQTPDGSMIPIMLIVHKTPDHDCYPDDDGVDTLVKNMVIDRQHFLFYGKWQGSFNDTPGTFTVNIQPRYSTYAHKDLPVLFGLKPDNDTNVAWYQNLNLMWRNEMIFRIDNGMTPQPHGRTIVDSTGNNISIFYFWNTISPDSIATRERTFTGHRIQ